MDLMFQFVGLAAMAFCLGFGVGRGCTSEPSEETMIERLINIRTERMLRAITRSDLEAEIDKAARHLVGDR